MGGLLGENLTHIMGAFLDKNLVHNYMGAICEKIFFFFDFPGGSDGSTLLPPAGAHVPTSKIHTHHDYIVPGFNEFAKQLHSEARGDYLLWKASGKPRSGLLYLNMCQFRIRFKRTLGECRQNEEIIRANAHANSLMEKDMTMYANFGINNFETTIRKSTYGFIQRLAKSTNSLIMTIEKSWIVRIDIWNFWQKTLYIVPTT